MRILAVAAGLAVLCVMPAGGAEAAESSVRRLGPEFQANSTTFFSQSEPSVATLSNGRFVVLFKDQSRASPDTSDAAVRMRRLSHSGSPLGGDSVVNAERNLDQEQPAVSRLGDGFVAVWTDASGGGADKSGAAIRGRRLSNAGAKLGKEFQVNRQAPGEQDTPAVALLTNGGFAAVYENSVDGVRGQVFSPANKRIGPELQANATDTPGFPHPSIAPLRRGGFVVAWTGTREKPGGRGRPTIIAQRFDAQGGKLGGELAVSSLQAGGQEHAAAAALSGDRYVVAWEDDSETGGDRNGLAVRGQIVSATAGKVGPQFLVPTKRAGDQFAPAVAAFPSGRFVVVWTDESGSPDDPAGSAIRAQLFSPNGAKLGGELRVNRRTNGNQGDPAVAVFDNRDFVVVWTDASFALPDQSASGIRGQVFRVTQ